MSSIPFFSILIPTKNRAHLVGYAIQSVLNQYFEDFELIIADNDDSEKTKDVVRSFNDSRIRYIRMGGINMADNWEAGLNVATGRYFTVLEDKIILYRESLKRLHQFITSQISVSVITWKIDVIYDLSKQSSLITQQGTGNCEKISSHWILEQMTKDISSCWDYLPRGLNSLVSMELISNITDNRRKPFFSLISPDFTSAFRILSEVEDVYHLDRTCGLVISVAVGTGYRYLVKKRDAGNFVGANGIGGVELKYAPIKNFYSVSNLLVNDYMTVRHESGGNLAKHDIEDSAYATMLLKDVARSIALSRRWIYPWKEIIELIRFDKKYFVNVSLLFWWICKGLVFDLTKKSWLFNALLSIGILKGQGRTLIGNKEKYIRSIVGQV